VHAAAQRPRPANPAWEAMGSAGRRIGLERFRDWCRDKTGHLRRVVREEFGADWPFGETVASAGALSCWARNAEKFPASGKAQSHGPTMVTERMGVVRHPYRPVGSITLQDSWPAMQMPGVPVGWTTRRVALNAMLDQVDHRKVTQPALEICCYSTKINNSRPLRESARFPGGKQFETWRLNWR
jgi:hypothetical protein